jgi:hypothetical protein
MKKYTRPKPVCKGGPKLGELVLGGVRAVQEPGQPHRAYEALIRADGETYCLGHSGNFHEANLLCDAAEKSGQYRLLGDGCQTLLAWTEC